MKKLTAKNLKEALWSTLNEIQTDKMDAARGDSVATQAREILRTANTQLRIAQQSKRPVSVELIEFAEDQK